MVTGMLSVHPWITNWGLDIAKKILGSPEKANQLALKTSDVNVQTLPNMASPEELGGEETRPKCIQGKYVIKAW